MHPFIILRIIFRLNVRDVKKKQLLAKNMKNIFPKGNVIAPTVVSQINKREIAYHISGMRAKFLTLLFIINFFINPMQKVIISGLLTENISHF